MALNPSAKRTCAASGPFLQPAESIQRRSPQSEPRSQRVRFHRAMRPFPPRGTQRIKIARENWPEPLIDRTRLNHAGAPRISAEGTNRQCFPGRPDRAQSIGNEFDIDLIFRDGPPPMAADVEQQVVLGVNID